MVASTESVQFMPERSQAESEPQLSAVRARVQTIFRTLGVRHLYLVVLPVVSVLVALAAFQSYRAIRNELTSAALERRDALAEVTASAVSGRMDQLTDIARALSTGTRFRTLVAERRWTEAVEIMQDVPRDFPVIAQVTVTAMDGTVMGGLPDAAGTRSADPSSEAWRQDVRDGVSVYVSSAFYEAGSARQPVFLVAATLTSTDKREVGKLVLTVRAERFVEWTKDPISQGKSSMVLIDSNRRIVFHSAQPRVETLRPVHDVLARKLERGDHRVEITADALEGSAVVSASAPVGMSGWIVVVEQSVPGAFAARDSHLRSLLTAYVLSILLISTVLYLAFRLAGERHRAARDQRMKLELENRVTERTAELEATNRELESFSYTVSHDLRSPLRAIGGFSQMLEEDHAGKLDDEGRRLLRVVRDNGEKMARLIDDLLAFSRLGRKPLTCSDTDMQDVVAEALATVRGEHREPATNVVVAPLPHAYCDRRLVMQVWANLLGNAIKFSARAAHPEVHVSAAASESEIVYTVSDNGAGFDMRYYDKLFSVFQRLHSDDEYKGTGVGLAIVHRIVTRHGGRVWAEGVPGRGATFHFTLPVVPPEKADAKHAD